MESKVASDTRKSAENAFASGLFCAESVVTALAQSHGIESDLLPGMATAFCSGIARTCGQCGALSGAVMGISLVFGRSTANDPVQNAYDPTGQLIREFERVFGARDCHALLGCDLGTPEGQEAFHTGNLHQRCFQYTGMAAEIAARLIHRQLMQIEVLASPEEAARLLRECDLPTEDISASQYLHFFGIRVAGKVAAAVGLELHPPFGLLRSLAIRPALRNRGLARALVTHAERFSAAQGIETLYLLTLTAEQFFPKLGYAPVPRDEAPSVIRSTSQFTDLCPASAALFSKRIKGILLT